MAIGDWDIETGGTLGEGRELTPENYPRSEEERHGTYPKVIGLAGSPSTEGIDDKGSAE